MLKPTVICLTPVQNEAWILERFLKCASLWADHIIIADQQSRDGSRDIARKFPKVILIDNPSSVFNEPERQKLLIDEARKFPEPRLLIAIDADEILTANFMTSANWDSILSAPKGAIVKFKKIELLPDMSSYWMLNIDFPFGFMDDGSQHIGKKIHSIRIPYPAHGIIITLQDIKVLHYRLVDMELAASKFRWYQCWEHIYYPRKKAVAIYREYSTHDSISKDLIYPIDKEWFLGYENKGIDIRNNVDIKTAKYWNEKVINFFDSYGAKKFKKIAVWDINWFSLANQANLSKDPLRYRDPRNIFDKLIHWWLRKTQPLHGRFIFRVIDKMLGWLEY